MSGTLYGISTGPGDPELITLKAVRIIEQCRTIAVPRTKGENTLALSIAEKSVNLRGKNILYLDFPMTSDKEKACDNYDRIAEMLCAELENNDIALLNLGDVGIYSTFSNIAERVTSAGYTAEFVSGVTSFSAASSLFGIPLVSKDEALTVIPYSNQELPDILRSPGTKVIMKTGSHAGELISLLRNMDLLEYTYIAENCGLHDERILKGTEPPEDFGYFTVFIVKKPEP